MPTIVLPASTAVSRVFSASRRSLRGAVALLLQWQERAEQRWQLTQMDHRMLKDLGISHADACREASKPFWRT